MTSTTTIEGVTSTDPIYEPRIAFLVDALTAGDRDFVLRALAAPALSFLEFRHQRTTRITSSSPSGLRISVDFRRGCM